MQMDAPSPPDPMSTAKAQSQMNRETAVTQQGLNMVDQYTPQGSLNYTQQGKWDDGTPRFAATTSLSPEQQGLYNQQTQLAGGVNNLALGQVGRLTGHLDTPFRADNE